MATRIEMWKDDAGNLHPTEALARRADLVYQMETFLNDHGGDFADEFNARKAAEALVDQYVLTPRCPGGRAP